MMVKTVRLRVILLWTLILIAMIGCMVAQRPIDQNTLEGRWATQDEATLNVPHSFFWFSMDVLEFRPDGTLLGLMYWPPGSDEALRLNKTAEYRLMADGRIAISGSCRDDGPCSAIYDFNVSNDILILSGEERNMTLKYSGPATQGSVPKVVAPVPTPQS